MFQCETRVLQGALCEDSLIDYIGYLYKSCFKICLVWHVLIAWLLSIVTYLAQEHCVKYYEDPP